MFAWKLLITIQARALVAAALICATTSLVCAAHEISYFPSFYPQEIRIESLDPAAAAREFVSKTDPLHVYLGGAPRFTGQPPAHLKSIASLKSLIVAGVNPQSSRMQNRDARCGAIGQAAAALAKQPDIVAHPFPVTPYHADYLSHADIVSAPKAATSLAPLTFRASKVQSSLLSPDVNVHATNWDIELGEVETMELNRQAGANFNAWPAPPWTKEGWFQAFHLLRPSVTEAKSRERADTILDRLTHGEFKDLAEETNLQRDLLGTLTAGCERAVVGYRLRTEFHNDDFSNGIEHILVDSQSGFNSPVVLRAVKLKDFFWNGWLRVGINERPAAAWNPLAGFTDAPGRLIWATVADNAFYPIPTNSRWVSNRAEIRQGDESSAQRSIPIPPDALIPQPRTGSLVPVGAGKGATAKVLYRVLASAFQDETVPEAADLLYPYALAYRWGADENKDSTYDPDISLATRLMRERLRGVKIIKVEEIALRVADLTFTHRSPIVEVYLNNLTSDEQQSALIAPPWSAVPWHVLALMEAAVERGIAAFSESEAKRRGVPWLDLVRDPAQLVKFRALIKEFAQTGYRPAALETLVGPETAKARWQMLDKFVEEKGHVLVTNGPYRLKSWSAESAVFDVNREFTYPVGLGTFNGFAYPPRALITNVEQADNRVLVAVDAEFAVKEQRDRRIVRMPLRRETLRDTLPIQTMPRYVAISADGRVAAAGGATRLPDGRFNLSLPPKLPAGAYTLITAIFLDGNTINPQIGRIQYQSK
ncbi:MAG: hypothetical protein HY659_14530 [Rhizobiales bacterium]|nr:hypothetical protein [Hyphomicrobiales bacterium]